MPPDDRKEGMVVRGLALIGIPLILISVALLLVPLANAIANGWSKSSGDSAMSTTLMWGRLAPFPKSAGRPVIKVEGSAFTRAFRTQFAASAAEIDQWLADSPGTAEAKDDSQTSGTRHFKITPGGGAQHAEVTADDVRSVVSIYVYWS